MVVFKSHWNDVTIPQEMGFTDYLLDKMKLYPDKIATIDSESGEKTTYQELYRQILSTASALHKHGFQKNDVTAVLSTNNVGFSLISLASIHLGGAVVGINTKYTLDGMMHQFEVCKPTFLAFSQEFQSVVEELQKKYNNLKKVFTLGPANDLHESICDLAKENIELPEITRDPKKDVAFYFFSSGTTGLPKAVPATHYNLLVSVLRHGLDGPRLIPNNSIFALITPMNHLISSGISSISCWCQGEAVVYFPKYNFPKLLLGIQQFKVNSIISVSTIANSFAYDPIVDDYDISSLKMCLFSAAPASEEVLISMKKRLNIPCIRTGYGMSEALAFTHFTSIEESKEICERGNVGKVLPNTLCKIAEVGTTNELGKNEKGEILIKCESLMLAYVNNPEATEAGFTDDGWWRSGDLGYVDDNENLFILDRLKDMIKVYGEQVSPSVLEEILLRHEAVSEVSVIGVPHSDLGEVPKAFIVLKSGKIVSEEDILKYFHSKVADFQRLRGGVQFIDHLPKNAMSKILKNELKAISAISTKQRN